MKISEINKEPNQKDYENSIDIAPILAVNQLVWGHIIKIGVVKEQSLY